MCADTYIVLCKNILTSFMHTVFLCDFVLMFGSVLMPIREISLFKMLFVRAIMILMYKNEGHVGLFSCGC